MSLHYCRPILFGVFVTVIICVAARPAEKNAQSIEIPNKSDFVQIFKFKPSESANPANDESRESLSKQISYNLSGSEGHRTAASKPSMSALHMHIPVRVIYDAPIRRYAAVIKPPHRPSPVIVRRNLTQRISPEDPVQVPVDLSPNFSAVNVENDPAKLRVDNIGESLIGESTSSSPLPEIISETHTLPREHVQQNDSSAADPKRCITKGMVRKYQLSILDTVLRLSIGENASAVLPSIYNDDYRQDLIPKADDDVIFGSDTDNCTTSEMAEEYKASMLDKVTRLRHRRNDDTTFASPNVNAVRAWPPIYDAPIRRYAAAMEPPHRPSPVIVRRNSKQRIFPEDPVQVPVEFSPNFSTVNVENDPAKLRVDNIGESLIGESTSSSSLPEIISETHTLPEEHVKQNDSSAADPKRCITKGMVRKYQLSILDTVLRLSIGENASAVLPSIYNDDYRQDLIPKADDDVIFGSDPNNCTTSEMAEEYKASLLDKVTRLRHRRNDGTTFASSNVNAVRAWPPSSSAYFPDAAQSSFSYAAPIPWQSQLQPAQVLPPYYYYGYYPPPSPAALDIVQRQWSSPFAQYFPIIVRDPFQSFLNSFSDLLEYGPAADVCQHKRDLQHDLLKATAAETESPYRTARSFDRRAKRNAHKKDNRGKYHYADTIGAADVTTTTPPKRKDSPKTAQPKQHGLLGGNSQGGAGNGEFPSNVRGADVGPQISKLIVRRGGVAIAGAGGIATAGSGGTAIVGPGGTAFTTPASSGGVAMVGPGGKVVKVSDLTDVLYGRTSNGNVAATGAGHATFTTKDGVFTTSDNTGGVALVNPGGGLFGVSDEGNLQQQVQQQQQQLEQQEQRAKAKQPNEVQLPAGARLLTTGPIIYYNPVYPAAVAAPVR